MYRFETTRAAFGCAALESLCLMGVMGACAACGAPIGAVPEASRESARGRESAPVTVPAPVGGVPQAMPAAVPAPSTAFGAPSPDATPEYHASPESIWLEAIGKGPEQTARVCARGGQDPIALALCAQTTPTIESLMDLHKVLGIPESPVQEQNNGRLPQQGAVRLIGMTANSASLVSRSVSALNPRVVVGVVPDRSEQGSARQFAVGFVRGEPFAELAGYDDVLERINFYLLVFEPTCLDVRCTPKELLTQSIEHGWRGWTLYQAEDLTNTPLDCLSCHQPDGADAPRRFLMRQLNNPWMHWMPQEPRNVNCGNRNQRNDGDDEDAAQASYVTPRLFDTFNRARVGEARYAGIELGTLGQVRAGRQLESFIQAFESAMGGGRGRLTAGGNAASVGESNVFPSRTVLSDSLCNNSQQAWTGYRDAVRGGGRPVPFYMPDVLDPARRDEAASDYGGFLERNAEADEFHLLRDMMSETASEAIGYRPAAGASLEATLSQMCVRCHNDNTDPSLSRARFNAQSLDRLTPEEAAEVVERISLPPDSPLLMPPRRFGDLPPPLLQLLRAYFEGRATAPGPQI